MEVCHENILEKRSVIMENKEILINFIWRFAERCGAQLVAFVVSIVLARLLDPDSYGTIALMTVFISIVQIFVDSGLGNSLIQKKGADNIDFSTVFYVNILFCFGLYIMLYIAAPFISHFYNDMEMISMIRVLGLTIIVSGLKNVQQAYVSRNMLFKRFFFSTLGGTVCAAVVGIVLAYKGFGVWALIAQNLANVTIDTVILWITVKWRPQMTFSLKRLKRLFSFGWKLMVSALLDTGYNNLWSLIIGKVYTPADLGFYNQGEKFPKMIVSNINTSIDSVLLPAMSNVQDEREHVRNMTRRSIMTSVYIMAPLMIGLSAVAEPLVRLLLTDKWLPCVPYLRIFCISYLFWPIHTANLNAINALGRSDLFLKLEIIKKAVGLTLLFITVKHSVMAMAYSLLISGFLSQLINSWPNRKLLDYSYTEQLRDIFPSIISATLMGVIIYPICYLKIANTLVLVIQMFLGSIIYICLSAMFKIDSFYYVLGFVKTIIDRRK